MKGETTKNEEVGRTRKHIQNNEISKKDRRPLAEATSIFPFILLPLSYDLAGKFDNNHSSIHYDILGNFNSYLVYLRYEF